MNVQEMNFDPYMLGINGMQMPQQQPPVDGNIPQEMPSQDMDSYVQGVSFNSEMAIPSFNYGSNGMMVGDNFGQMNAQMMNFDNVSATSELSETSDSSSESTFMDTLSEAFRANADSIQSTMDSLGLTLEDLTDEDNLTTLANAMNEGAKSIGVPTIDNLDEVVDNIINQINGTSADSTEDTASVTETSSSDASGSGSSSSSEDETTTEIVTINGVTYLETTTTENGVETTTRTVLSTDEA